MIVSRYQPVPFFVTVQDRVKQPFYIVAIAG